MLITMQVNLSILIKILEGNFAEKFGKKEEKRKFRVMENSWEICCACARLPFKLEDFPEEILRDVRGCCIFLNACLIFIIFLLVTKTK
jgi:hypothetical protein